jgi:hypothetical protein
MSCALARSQRAPSARLSPTLPSLTSRISNARPMAPTTQTTSLTTVGRVFSLLKTGITTDKPAGSVCSIDHVCLVAARAGTPAGNQETPACDVCATVIGFAAARRDLKKRLISPITAACSSTVIA